MITFQIGDQVRHRQTGSIGFIAGIPREFVLRDCVLVKWPQVSEPMLAKRITIEKVKEQLS